MEKHENNELHSREVREIMEKQPSWIIRWGILLITLILVAAAFVSRIFYV
jgi:hypothetical protein